MKIVAGHVTAPGAYRCSGLGLDHFDGAFLLQPGDKGGDESRRHVLNQENRGRQVSGQQRKEGADCRRTTGGDSNRDGTHVGRWQAGGRRNGPTSRAWRRRGRRARTCHYARYGRSAYLGNQLVGNHVQFRGDGAFRLANEIERPQLQAFESFDRALLRQRAEHDHRTDSFGQNHLHGGDAIQLWHVDIHGHNIGF